MKQRIIQLLAILPLLLPSFPVLAATYTVPGGPLPSGCSYNGAAVNCSGNLIMGNNDVINVDSPTTMNISGNWSFGNNLEVNVGGDPADLAIVVAGDLFPGNNAIINASLTVAGDISSGKNGSLQGDLIVSGDLSLGENSTIEGNVTVSGTLDAGNNVSIEGDISATDVILGVNSTVTGDIEAENVTISNNALVDGNINATDTVTNNGTVTGYINADNIEGNGSAGETCDINENVGPCNGGGGGQNVLYYLIDHDGSALTCQAETVQVHACANANCTSLAQITGSLDLVASGPGTFSAPGTYSASGTAAVQLPVPVPGAYTLSIANADVVSRQPTQCTSGTGSGCTMNAVNTAFDWQTIGTQTAGAPFSVLLRAIRTDNQTGACVAALQGQTDVDLAVSCDDPGTCISGGSRMSAAGQSLTEQPAYTTAALTFDNTGTAQIGMNYEDAGAVSLHARKTVPTGAQLSGSSNSFVVRPAAIGFSFSGPGGYPAGVFARAGEDFSVTLSALSANGNITANFGNESSPARLTLESSTQVVTPAGGSSGLITLSTAFTKTADGVFSSNGVRYSEAGTAAFTGHVQGGDYLGTGDVSNQGPAAGRFIPWAFRLDLGAIVPACTSQAPGFSYMGQDFSVTVEVSARNRNNVITVNYPDGTAEATAELVGADTGDFTPLTGRLSPASHSLTWNQGEGTLTNADALLERIDNSSPDGPFTSFQLGLRVDDQETGGPLTPLASPDFNANEENCAGAGTCNAYSLDSPLEIVFGRLVLEDGFAPVNEAAEVAMEAQYWDGDEFLRRTDDSCTAVDYNDMSIISNPSNLSTQPDGTVTVMDQGRSPADSLLWTAPGAPGEVGFLYSAPAWMRHGMTNSGNPDARVLFGLYRGHDRVIYWRSLP